VTVPAPGAERELRRALAGVPADRLTDQSVIESVAGIAEVLGPASLAFTDAARFRDAAQLADTRLAGLADTLAPAAGRARAVGQRWAVSRPPVSDERVHGLLDSVSAADAAETDLARIGSDAHVVLDGDRVVAAAGYLTWPGSVAHLSVLTDPAFRGLGLAKLAGSSATADALARGLLPQWRARVPASIRVAASLGFVGCGSQLSFRLAGAA
jgi:GNAT superfamily N-acetyltransferase